MKFSEQGAFHQEKRKEEEKKERKKKKKIRSCHLLLGTLSSLDIKEVDVAESFGLAGIPVLHDADPVDGTELRED